MKAAGWLKGLEVTVGGAGIVSHAVLVLLRALSDKSVCLRGSTGRERRTLIAGCRCHLRGH